VPFLRATARLPKLVERTVRVPLGRRIVSQAGRLQFYTVKIENGVAMPAFKGSGEITSLSQADGYIQIPAYKSVIEDGEYVDVKPEAIEPPPVGLYKQRMEDLGKDDPTTYRCLPPGPRQLFAPQGWVRIIQTPAMIALLYENLLYRQIFMDGRGLPKDPNP